MPFFSVGMLKHDARVCWNAVNYHTPVNSIKSTLLINSSPTCCNYNTSEQPCCTCIGALWFYILGFLMKLSIQITWLSSMGCSKHTVSVVPRFSSRETRISNVLLVNVLELLVDHELNSETGPMGFTKTQDHGNRISYIIFRIPTHKYEHKQRS